MQVVVCRRRQFILAKLLLLTHSFHLCAYMFFIIRDVAGAPVTPATTAAALVSHACT